MRIRRDSLVFLSGGTTATSSLVIDDNVIVRGDGGARGVQGSGILISDVSSNNVTLSATAGNSLTLATADTNRNILLVPHGTGAVQIPMSVSSGFQLYNTVDQTTNYERLEALWNGNTARIRTALGGTGTSRAFTLQAAGASTATAELTIRRDAFPFFAFTQSGALSSTGTTTFVSVAPSTYISTAGTHVPFAILPVYNQASGTAANTDLLINRTETAVGSGTQRLIDAQVGGSSRFTVANSGAVGTVSAITALQYNSTGAGYAATNWATAGILLRMMAGTWTDSSTAASGTAATAVFSSFAQPTLAATNATVTTTDAATVYIAAAPAAGTNMTITNAYALWIDAGLFRLDGTTGAGATLGTLTNAPSAGDPDKWIPINSDGVQYWFPAWAS